MTKTFRFSPIATVAFVALGVLSFFDAVPAQYSSFSNMVFAQGQNRNWNGGQNRGGFGGQNGQNRGGFGGQNGQNRGGNGGQNGQNRGGNGNRNGNNRGGCGGQNGGRGGNGAFSPEQIVANMTQERFERLRNTQWADRIKEQVGNDRWAQWERGDFTASVSVAEQAAAAAEGRPLDRELTEEEKQQAEEILRRGSVPNFSSGRPYSTESENEYMQKALEHRDDSLVSTVPVAIRFYSRYLLSKYDLNGNGQLEQREWEDKIQGAQAIDLDRDWILTDQEILFYLANYAKDRTIANPRPIQPRRVNLVVEKQEQPLLIRTASAAPRAVNKEDAEKELNEPAENIEQMSDEEFVKMLTEDNPAMESVEDEELLDVLLSDMDESTFREYAAAPEELIGTPVWFLARDVNGDGQLSLREFAPNLTAAGVAQFGKLDLNADGLITAEEVKKAVGGSNAQK